MMQTNQISILTVLSISLLLIGGTAGNAFAITVTPETDASDLVDNILGGGVTIIGTPTLTGTSASCIPTGTFTDGFFSGLGIDEGIVITSGEVTLIDNTNDADNSSCTSGEPGDADLTAIVGDTTFDAAVLTFDFEFGDGTIGGDLFFEYALGSEEYNEFVNSEFNDVFALFVDGVNVAIVPTTVDEVAINSVNCDNPFNPPSGSNCGFYNNNDPNDPAATFNFEYDGFTDTFTAEVLGLTPGTHTMEIKIADTSDTFLDSGVFIKGESFSGEEPAAFGDFTCWAALEDEAFITPNKPLTIMDQFNDERQPIDHDEWEQAEYCTATTKFYDGQEFRSPFFDTEPVALSQHYQSWFYHSDEPNGGVPNDGTGQSVIITVDQFNQQFTTTLGELDQIMVPATKFTEANGEVASEDFDHHWNCYNIEGPAPEQPLVDTLVTQHSFRGDIEQVTVGNPILFCLPMIKDNHQDPPFGELLDDHMICYDIVSNNNPVQIADLPFQLLDQLNTFPVPFIYDQINFVQGLEKLCVPALKSFEEVGGFDIPINTSSLLLAGVSSVSMWMIPVVIAGVGIGIFVIKRRN
jgi:hypothetical protein